MAADDALGVPSSRARARLEAIRKSLVLEMMRLLARLSTTEGELASDEAALDNARRIRWQVLSLIRDDGLPVVIEAGEAAVADAVEIALGAARRTVTQAGAGVAVSFDAEAKDAIERSVSGVLDEVADAFSGVEDSIRRSIDIGLNTSAPLDELTSEIARKLDTTFARAATAVETALRSAARATTGMQTERAAEATGVEMGYLYDGPIDNKTRPFCRENVGKVFTKEALGGMDNGTAYPVLWSAGGPGCRHRLSPTTLESAREQGLEVIE